MGESSTTTGGKTKICTGESVVPGAIYRGRGRGGLTYVLYPHVHTKILYAMFHPHPAVGMKVEQGCRCVEKQTTSCHKVDFMFLAPSKALL